MRLTLGCPTLRRYDLLEKMLLSAHAGTCPPERYLVIDNGGSFVASAALQGLPLEVHAPGENLGCARSWNLMAQRVLLAEDDALLIAADDVSFEADAIESALGVMESGDYDFVTPEPGGFSCFLVRKRLFDKVGMFDEQFWPAYFEDNDFHRRMTLSGIVTEARAMGRYDHVNKGSQTVATFTRAEKMEHNKRFEANRDRYVAKWGGLPHHEKFVEPYNGIGSD